MATIRDARGRVVPIIDPGVDWILDRRERFDPETLDRIMAEFGVRERRVRRALIVGVGVVAGMAALSAALIAVDIAIEGRAAFRDLVSSFLFTGPAVVAMLVAAVVVPILVARRHRLDHAREVLLRHGHCPSCGYRIDAAAEGDRGGDAPAPRTIVCAECGASWLVGG